MKHLKDVGFINRNGVILKDPDSIRKKFNYKTSIRRIIKNGILNGDNFFLRNNILTCNKTINNTINNINTINFDIPVTSKKKQKEFKSIFNSLNEKPAKKKMVCPDIKTICILPKMSRTYYFPRTQAKKLDIHEKDGKKSNISAPRNDEGEILTEKYIDDLGIYTSIKD